MNNIIKKYLLYCALLLSDIAAGSDDDTPDNSRISTPNTVAGDNDNEHIKNVSDSVISDMSEQLDRNERLDLNTGNAILANVNNVNVATVSGSVLLDNISANVVLENNTQVAENANNGEEVDVMVESVRSSNTDIGQTKDEYDLDDERANEHIRNNNNPLTEEDRQRLVDLFNTFIQQSERIEELNNHEYANDDMTRSPSIDLADFYSELPIDDDLLEKIKHGYLPDGREITDPQDADNLRFQMMRGFARYLLVLELQMQKNVFLEVLV